METPAVFPFSLFCFASKLIVFFSLIFFVERTKIRLRQYLFISNKDISTSWKEAKGMGVVAAVYQEL